MRRVIIALTLTGTFMVVEVVGGILAVVSGVYLAILIISWLVAGGPAFTETRKLVFTSTGFVFGLQLVSASLFLTLFRDRPVPLSRRS